MFVKYWQAGAVKTRLARSIGASEASRLYRDFVACLIRRFADTADQRQLCYWPPDKRSMFERRAGGSWNL